MVRSEVASKRGLRAAALKAGFRAFQAVRPDMMERAVNALLPHFVPVLDPLWREGRDSGDARSWFTQHGSRVADGLLEVTDALAVRAKNRVLVKIYRGLRGQARAHVLAAVPALAVLIDEHLQ